MSVPPESIGRGLQWLETAKHDLINASHTLTLGEDCPFDTVCFHAHQCTEKSLKGLLVAYAIDFPKTHDLVILLRLARSAGLAKVEIDEVQPLNRYAVEARYPGNWEPITRQEAEEAFAMARKVREAVLVRFPAGYSEQAE